MASPPAAVTAPASTQLDWPITTNDNGTATTRTYDAAGQLTKETVPTVLTPFVFGLDAQGRTTAITDTDFLFGFPILHVTTLRYDGASDLTTLSLPGSVSSTMQYDASARLTQLSVADTGNTAFTSNYAYGYDGLNRTSAITSTVGGATTTQSLTHDALGRLTGDGTTSYSYQPSGNLNQVTGAGVTSSYHYDTAGQPNELTSLTTTGQPTRSYGYDSTGTRGTATNSGGDTTIVSTNSNLAADCPAGSADPSSTCLGYDSRGRLQRVALPRGTTVTMTYNAAGQRASYVVTGTSPRSETFSYRGGELAQEVVVAGGSTTTYSFLYRPGGTPFELIVTAGVNLRYWYVTDGRGNVVALTDGLGNVVDRYHYDLWGVPTIDQEGLPQPLLYAGYFYDRELGWYWLASRPYDPALKRFTQPDPSMQEGVRSYVYAGDDPVDATDPSGFEPCGGGGRGEFFDTVVPSCAGEGDAGGGGGGGGVTVGSGGGGDGDGRTPTLRIRMEIQRPRSHILRHPTRKRRL